MPVAPTLVFDLDGTLAETAGDLIGALNFVLAGEGRRAGAGRRARARCSAPAGGRSSRAASQLSGRELAPATLEALFVDFLAYYNAHIADGAALFPGVEACLDALRRGGLAARGLHQQDREVLGHAPARQARRRRALRLRLRPGHVRGRQARPEAAAGDDPHVGGDPRRAVMVGDSRTDIETARAAGVAGRSPSTSAIPTFPSPNSGPTG